jgi:hypothetical protein
MLEVRRQGGGTHLEQAAAGGGLHRDNSAGGGGVPGEAQQLRAHSASALVSVKSAGVAPSTSISTVTG